MITSMTISIVLLSIFSIGCIIYINILSSHLTRRDRQVSILIQDKHYYIDLYHTQRAWHKQTQDRYKRENKRVKRYAEQLRILRASLQSHSHH